MSNSRCKVPPSAFMRRRDCSVKVLRAMDLVRFTKVSMLNKKKEAKTMRKSKRGMQRARYGEEEGGRVGFGFLDWVPIEGQWATTVSCSLQRFSMHVGQA